VLASKSHLRKGFTRIRILVVSQQSEQIYAERALCAGGSGYWMRNSLAEELMHAIETVLAGEIYASSANHVLAMRKLAGGRNGSVRRVRACAVDHHSVDSPVSPLQRLVLTKFHAKSQNKVDDVIRSVSCRVMRTGIVRALIALATSDQAIPTTQMGLDGLLLLENVTRARNRREIA